MTKRPDLASIATLVADVQEQVEQIMLQGEVPDSIDVELLEATTQFLAANVSVYRKCMLGDEAAIAVEPVISGRPEPSVDPAPILAPESRIDVEPEFRIDVEPVAETSVEEVPEEEVQSVEEEPIWSEPEPEEEPEFPTRPMSINEILANQMKEGAYSRPGAGGGTAQQAHYAVTNLKSAINLNDKLLFIKDLFNGYSLAYNEAIDLLNRYDSFEEADKFLQNNYAAKNQWDAKPETVNKLYAVLRRRFDG